VQKLKLHQAINCSSLDGHGSHLTIEFIEYYDQNGMFVMTYPCHLTHSLQPLNFAMFKPLPSTYSCQVAAFMENWQDPTSMSKRHFYPIFVTAWKTSFKGNTILKALEATGLSTFEPEIMLEVVNTRQAVQEISSNSESSALCALNWSEAESLLRKVVNNRGDLQA
jgi:hypothetical protein